MCTRSIISNVSSVEISSFNEFLIPLVIKHKSRFFSYSPVICRSGKWTHGYSIAALWPLKVNPCWQGSHLILHIHLPLLSFALGLLMNRVLLLSCQLRRENYFRRQSLRFLLFFGTHAGNIEFSSLTIKKVCNIWGGTCILWLLVSPHWNKSWETHGNSSRWMDKTYPCLMHWGYCKVCISTTDNWEKCSSTDQVTSSRICKGWLLCN